MAIDAASQAALIKSAALSALKKAFEKYPVNVSEGAPNTGDHRANVVDGSNGTNCGVTPPWTIFQPVNSDVFYLQNMEFAQWSIPIQINTTQDLQNALHRTDLMRAIGAGIGNNAAHELAHQFLNPANGTFGMDDNSTNTYNGIKCDTTTSWLFDNGLIQWETITANALKNAFGTGWHF